ncbi:MAG: MFS transporter [Gammaproteobacteria bacterium]|nr:MFS transporter [Gammaproteobacteria bacterium]NNF50428.1 MFS transporter [Woeseiaceae bacterium]MBT8094431.1 MFS transporter [Gammaproteobacteria bacterium]MBT8105250.1 MFS transporter [Gammaproteobacteria bacterium]NNK25264.1 MFS transporter [Woeseiaceae bacterium]
MSGQSQFKLLQQRRFAPFFVTQFLGALNDNVFRNGLVILITFQGIVIAGMDHTQLANVAAGLFILPYFLFSATAGQLADKYEKSMLIRRVKLLEIGLMAAACVALVTGSYALLLLVLFFMGLQSTMFGPVKYAYLPQQLADDELIGGNALVESGTYIAIILGLIAGGIAVGDEIAAALGVSKQAVLGACLVGVAVTGYLASREIPVTRAVDPDLRINWNAWQETWHIVQFAREERSVFLSILGISWFWFYGSAMTIQIPAYTLDILNGSESITTFLLAAFAVGVGIGSLLCERLSGHRIELGLVPFGAIGMSWFAIDLYFANPDAHAVAATTIAEFLSRPGGSRIWFDLVMIGAFGGFYSVPLYALIQQRSKRSHLSRIIAANNIINAVLMVTAAIMSMVLLNAGLSIPQLFFVVAVLNVLVAVYIFSLLPEFLLRFLAWIVVTVLYRIKPQGVENLPVKGPAVVVCNHVSYIDPIILSACVPQPMRFVMWYKIFQMPLLNFIFRTGKAIPIASAREDVEIMNEAFEKVDAELAAGRIVCIFPEGAITRDGEIARFRPGIEKILARRPVPVIPASLGRLWGSWFSRRRDGGLRKIPGRLFARIPVRFGKAVPPSEVTAARLEILVRTLRGDER